MPFGVVSGVVAMNGVLGGDADPHGVGFWIRWAQGISIGCGRGGPSDVGIMLTTVSVGYSGACPLSLLSSVGRQMRTDDESWSSC